MAVTFSPLTSQAGFSSPGFVVSPTGDLTISGSASFESIIINGTTLLDPDNPEELNNQIITSSLTSLGILVGLNVTGNINVVGNVDVTGNTNIKDSQNNENLVIDDGVITLSSTTKGNIDNIALGQNIPAEANITFLTANDGVITVLSSTTIQTEDIAADDIVINNQPTELFHSTRKDYVDNRVSAFSIAFGA
jgi:hypothetical protein